MGAARKTAVVTGGSGGIGLEVARVLRGMGYDLVLVSRSAERLERARGELLRSGEGEIAVVVCDLAREKGAEELHARCGELGVRADVLVNNAGFGFLGEHVRLAAERAREMATLNVTALTVLCSLFGREMKARGAGHIMNVASTASFQPLPYFAEYAATKSYVRSFSLALSKELEPFGVRVSCLCPGPTETPFFEAAGITEEQRVSVGLKGLMSSATVAKVGVRGMFAGRRVVIPGWRNRLTAVAGRMTPRGAVLWAVAKVLGKVKG